MSITQKKKVGRFIIFAFDFLFLCCLEKNYRCFGLLVALSAVPLVAVFAGVPVVAGVLVFAGVVVLVVPDEVFVSVSSSSVGGSTG